MKYIIIVLFFISCGKKDISTGLSDPNRTGDLYQSRINAYESGEKEFVDFYTPESETHYNDSLYMNRMNELIENAARKHSSKELFFKLSKTVGWIESNWQHYLRRDAQIFVITGDDGKSFGLFQINSRYHGVIPNLKGNVTYALDFLYEIYLYALKNDCQSGSNSGTDEEALIRRIYAHYNGGQSGRCRNKHKFDDRFVKYFYSSPWDQYLY